MSTKSFLFAAVLGVLSVPAFAQNPVHCEFLIDGKVIGLPDVNLDWGSSAYAFTTDAGLTFTAALSGCADFCLQGAPFTALQARISKDGKDIASTDVSPINAIKMILDAPAENAKIVCQEVQVPAPITDDLE